MWFHVPSSWVFKIWRCRPSCIFFQVAKVMNVSFCQQECQLNECVFERWVCYIPPWGMNVSNLNVVHALCTWPSLSLWCAWNILTRLLRVGSILLMHCMNGWSCELRTKSLIYELDVWKTCMKCNVKTSLKLCIATYVKEIMMMHNEIACLHLFAYVCV